MTCQSRLLQRSCSTLFLLLLKMANGPRPLRDTIGNDTAVSTQAIKVSDFGYAFAAAAIGKTFMAPYERSKLVLPCHADPPISHSGWSHPTGWKLLSWPQKKIQAWISRHRLVQIIRHDGFFSMWRGNTIHAARYAAMMSVNFGAYSTLARASGVRGRGAMGPSRSSGFLDHASCGALGAVLTGAVLHPIDMIRTELSLEHRKYPRSKERVPTFRIVAEEMYAKSGLQGLYRGFSFTASASMVYRAGFFGFYFGGMRPSTAPDQSILTVRHAAAAYGSVLAASYAMYPLDTIRRRFFFDKEKNSLIKTTKNIIRIEGVKALFKGSVALLPRAISGAITLLLFDHWTSR